MGKSRAANDGSTTSSITTGDEDVYDELLRKRLEHLVMKSSQAELARKLGIPAPNISRYLKNVRLPAAVCVALVEKAGVNPAWLLAGEGAPYLADVRAEVGAGASDLLELVQAMAAVTRLKLGALAGKDEQKTLRELNNTLKDYEKLREELVRRVGPFFTKLLDELGAAIDTKDVARADRLWRAISQVGRLCQDPALLHRFHRLETALFYNSGRAIEALGAMRQLVQDRLSAGLEASPELLLETTNFAIGLRTNLRSEEAMYLCRAILEFSAPLREVPRYDDLDYILGSLEFDMGDAHAGYSHMLRAFTRMTPAARENCEAQMDSASVIAGARTLDEQLVIDEARIRRLSDYNRRARHNTIIGLACMLEVWPQVEAALRIYVTTQDERENRLAPFFALRLLEARDGQGKAALEAFVASPLLQAQSREAAQLAAFGNEAMHCQLLRVAGREDEARERLRAADRILLGRPAGWTEKLSARAAHYRNAWLLARGDAPDLLDMKERARTFFSAAVAKGFACFRDAALS